MNIRHEQLAHLQRLSAELTRQGFTTQLSDTSTARPHLKVANTSTPSLNEDIYAQQAGGGTWAYYWPWSQPIGPTYDLATVTGKIATVLRSVGDHS